MKHQDKKSLTWIKAIFLLPVIGAILLMASISMAAGGGGTTPATAVTLDAKVNQGHLDPLNQQWFKFVGDPQGRSIDIEKTLTLIFTPKENYTVNYVNLNIFEEDQIQNFFKGDTSNMKNLGSGSLVERDSNPQTGELVWTGWIFGPKTYYVQVVNNSDFPVDFYLFNADVKQAELGQPEQPPAAPPPAVAPPQAAGVDPANPTNLSPDGLTKGKLAPNATGWYTFDIPDPDNKNNQVPLEFTLFFTPDDGNLRHKVNFELFPAGEVDFWLRGDGKESMSNFGSGQLVSRDGDYNTGERLWSGSVINGDKYLLAINNNTGIEIDYYLFQGDVYRPELGPKTAAKPAQVFAPGKAPTTATPLQVGENVGHLNPGEQAWHSFFITTFDGKSQQPMALTMVMTPDDGNRIYNVPFDVFRAGNDVQYWSSTDSSNTQIVNMGVGSVVFRDNNPETGERFWNGWVLNNNLYLVQVRNGANVPIDYHLFTGDVYRPELGGKKTQPAVEVAAAVGEVRSKPIPLGLGVNKGSLKPGDDTWYSFSRADVAQSGGNTAFTLVFMPNDGNRVYNVGLELFSGDQNNSFGKGSVVERDKDVKTGELVWNGNVLPGITYYMHVSNGTTVPIDFWIFPEDVVSANLQ